MLRTDSYEETCAGVEVCLAGIAKAMGDNGVGNNRESDVELRSCSSIYLKRPCETAKTAFLSVFSFLSPIFNSIDRTAPMLNISNYT